MSFMDKAKAEAKKQIDRREEWSEFEKVNWWKPEAGDNMVRLLPHWSGDSDELFFHRNVIHWNVEVQKSDGSGTVALAVRCLKEFKKDCPLCDQYEKASKEEKKDLNSTRPSEQFLYNIYDIQKKEFFVYGAPVTVHTQIWEWVEDIGADPSSHTVGRNWKIVKKTDGSGKMNVKYSVRPKLEPSEFPSNLVAEYEKSKVSLDGINSEDHEEAIYRAAGVVSGDTPSVSKEDDIPFNDGFAAEKGSGNADGGVDPDSNSERAKFKMDKKEEEKEATLEDFGINIEDDELEKQLKELGVE